MVKTMSIIIVSFVIGIVGSAAVAAYAVNGNHTGLMHAYTMHTTDLSTKQDSAVTTGSMMSSDDMMSGLQGKTGDTFDKTFISEMITHHQGAINMATLALTSSRHQEIKDLAKNIISAQTSEIAQMKMWQAQWGYTAASSDNSMPDMQMGQ